MNPPAFAAPSTSSSSERILDIAAALFWKRGFAATTTREIAAAAGMQQASLYHHMASKEDLLFQICKTSLELFLEEVQAAAESVPDPVERLQTLIRSHVTTLLRHQQRNVTMLTELRSLAPAHKTEVAALRARYAGFVQAALESAQSSGSLRNDISARFLCLALLNVLNWSALWFREGNDETPEKLASILTQLYLNGALTQPAPPSVAYVVAKPVARTRKSAKTSTLDRVLDAALGLFAAKGYAGASTREVAALLGIQKASLYYHIQSKEDLLYAICKSSLEQIQADVVAALEGVTDPVERVRTLLVAHTESMLRNAVRHQTTFSEMHALRQERLKEIVAARAAYENLARGIFQQAQDQGVVRTDIDARYVTLAGLGLLNRIPVWYKRGGALSPNQLGHLLAAIFLTGARARE